MKNLLVAQSGGPTSAINATIAGVIMEAHASDQVDTIYGAVNGIKGVLEERFVNLSEKVPGEDELEILCQTPAAALGSCRVKLKNPAEDDSQFQEIIRIFRKHEIMYFIYAGGNDSMDTVDKHTVKNTKLKIFMLWEHRKPSITIWWERITARDLVLQQNI